MRRSSSARPVRGQRSAMGQMLAELFDVSRSGKHVSDVLGRDVWQVGNLPFDVVACAAVVPGGTPFAGGERRRETPAPGGERLLALPAIAANDYSTSVDRPKSVLRWAYVLPRAVQLHRVQAWKGVLTMSGVNSLSTSRHFSTRTVNRPRKRRTNVTERL
jgi:hypothetical protein